MPVSLRETAEANGLRLSTTADAACGAPGTGALAEVRDLVGSTRPATNAVAAKVADFTETGSILDARRHKIHTAGGNAAAGLAAFETAQGTYFLRRQAFEDLWSNGRRAVYFALNPGTAGVLDYGPFCLVVEDPPTTADAAVFPGNTAATYADATGTVDEARALGDACPWPGRGDVAVAGGRPDLVGAPPGARPGVLDHQDTAMELVTVEDVSFASVDTVRMVASDLDDLEELRAEWMARHRAIARDELELIGAYERLRALERAGSLAIEGV